MDSIRIGDEVVHQGAPGRFTVVKVEPSPGMNVYSRILTIRGADGKETKVLDTAVRALPPRTSGPEGAEAKPEEKQAKPEGTQAKPAGATAKPTGAGAAPPAAE